MSGPSRRPRAPFACGTPAHPLKTGAAVAVAVALSLACSESSDTVSAPDPPAYTVSGRVRIVMRLTTPIGQVTGTASVDDADGIRVALVDAGSGRGATPVASALTEKGAYALGPVASGTYRVVASIAPAVELSTAPLAVSDADVAVADTLEILPEGDLSTYPNPFPASAGLSIEFTTETDEPAMVEVLTAGGVPFRHDPAAPIVGFQHIHWSCFDDDLETMPHGAYWVRLYRDGGYHYNYVIKEAR